MTITQIEYALAVNKFRHFGQAAKSCHVTQPTLSMQIQKLEEELGVIIFDRSKSPVLPTREGEAFLKQGMKAVFEFNRIRDVLNSAEAELSGEFKLAVIPTLAPYLTPYFIGPFAKKYPKVHLIIEEVKTEDILFGLNRDQFDAGLLVTPLFDDSLIERSLFYEPFYVYASPQHPLASKKNLEEKDLIEEGLWLLNEGHCFRNQMMRICRFKGKGSGVSNVEFESGHLGTLQNLVEKSGGYTLLPELATIDLSEKQKSLLHSFNSPVPTREVSLVHSRTFLKERIIVALEEEIVGSLPESLRSLKKKDVKIIDI